MKNIEFCLKYNNCSWNTEGVQEDIEFQLGKIANEMIKLYTTSCIIVVIKNCDQATGGSYDTMNIHVYNNFIEANEMINREMYTSNAIDIYQYNCTNDHFTVVMNKCYDSSNFYRLAGIQEQVMFDDSFKFKMRKVFDMKETNVTLHPVKL